MLCWLLPFAAFACCIAHPAHCQCQAACCAHFNRNLVVRTTYAAAFHFYQWFGIVNRFVKYFDGFFALHFFGNLFQCAVHNAFCNGFFAVDHQHVHEFGQFNAAEFRIGQYVALGDFSTSWHFNSLNLFSWGIPMNVY